MKSRTLLRPGLIACVVLFVASAAFAQTNSYFTVNSVADSVDNAPGDGRCADSAGRCTLRAAIGEANANPTPDVIIFGLPAPSTIGLTLGELVVSSGIEIIGPGARRLTVTRTGFFPAFRIFRVVQNSTFRRLSLRGMSITQGSDVGGGLCIEAGNTVYLADVSMTGNRGTLGAAIYNEGTLTVQRSFIGANGVEAAANHGGGLYNAVTGTASVYNTTFAGNIAGDAGAIYNAGSLELVNDTFAGNRATAASSILANGATPVRVMNTIIGRDDSANGANAIAGVFVSGGNNIVTDARESEGFVDGQSNDRISLNNLIDPRLGPVGNNGGQVDSIVPLADSPAVDGGNSCVFSAVCAAPFASVRIQRDLLFMNRRAAASVDIGAVERGSTPLQFLGPGFPLRPGTISGGSLLVVTNTVSNVKSIRPLLPSGLTRIPTNWLDVELVEVVAKRSGQSFFTINDPDAIVIIFINGMAVARDVDRDE